MEGTTLADFANALMHRDRVRRVLVLTEGRTGNPALLALDLTQVAHLTAVAYSDDTDDPDVLPLADAWRRVAPPCAEDRYDLVMLDPFHTYASSRACIEGCLDVLQPDGLMLVHDCLPPPAWTRPVPVLTDEGWCGVTFAAMRDVCTDRGVQWFTIDTDFGIGVAVPRPATVESADVPAWTLDSHDDYLARYVADPFALMRTVAGPDGWTAIERVLRNEPVDDLLAPFTGWGAPHVADAEGHSRPTALAERELMARMVSGVRDELNRERDHQPTWREIGYHVLRRLGLR